MQGLEAAAAESLDKFGRQFGRQLAPQLKAEYHELVEL
jgi:hypothetical protein